MVRFGLIGNLDYNLKKDSNNETIWTSYMINGKIILNDPAQGCGVVVDDNSTVEYTTKNSNDKGQSFRITELITFNGVLLALDEKTGLIYVHHNNVFLAWMQVPEFKGSTIGTT